MDFKDYLKNLFLILKVSEIPIDEINAKIGYLRLQNIYLYEPCLEYVVEEVLSKKNKMINHQIH